MNGVDSLIIIYQEAINNTTISLWKEFDCEYRN